MHRPKSVLPSLCPVKCRRPGSVYSKLNRPRWYCYGEVHSKGLNGIYPASQSCMYPSDECFRAGAHLVWENGSIEMDLVDLPHNRENIYNPPMRLTGKTTELYS
jgi:hypothetical protein